MARTVDGGPYHQAAVGLVAEAAGGTTQHAVATAVGVH